MLISLSFSKPIIFLKIFNFESKLNLFISNKLFLCHISDLLILIYSLTYLSFIQMLNPNLTNSYLKKKTIYHPNICRKNLENHKS